MSKKKNKYIQAPTSDDLARIEAGEKFSDITAGPIKKVLNGALNEDIDEIEELSEVEEQPVVKKHNTVKRSMYFSIGLFFTVMAIIGLIFSVNFCINFMKNVADNTKQKNEFAKFISPVVVVDPPSFKAGTNLPIEVMMKAAIWNIIINEDTSKYEKSFDNIVVPASDVEVETTKLFGKGINFSHQTLGDANLYFEYDEDKKSYIIPESPQYFPYSPKVEEITKVSDDKFELKVGYYPPVQSWRTSDKQAKPDKYMKYTLKKDGNSYSIISIEEYGQQQDTTT